MMSQNTKTILIGAIVAILAIAAYFFFKSKNDKLTSWRTDPAKVDIVVSENKHDLEVKNSPKPIVVAADSVAVESIEVADEPFEPIEINLKASTVGELAEKMKRETEGLLSNDPFLSPSNIKLNLKNNSFSCIIVKSDVRTNFIKLGLYYGPANSGCESCLTVIEKNPGSIVFASAKGNGLIGQVIGLK
jgi:hypothetical protein